jgi:rhodanese-related sulfurtransferase
MRRLQVRDAHALIANAPSGHKPLLLDVREPWELQTASIGGSGAADAPVVAIPMREVPARLDEINRGRSVICICHHGMRSLQVALYLEQQGFGDVINLEGGIDAWSSEIDPGVPRY